MLLGVRATVLVLVLFLVVGNHHRKRAPCVAISCCNNAVWRLLIDEFAVISEAVDGIIGSEPTRAKLIWRVVVRRAAFCFVLFASSLYRTVL